MAKVNRLNPMQIKTLTKPGRYSDGGGLILQVRSAENRSWILRYMIAGKAREMGLGPESSVSLAQARAKAAKAKEQIANGGDPLAQKHAEQEAKRAQQEAERKEKAAKTFREAMEDYLTANEAA